MKTLICILLLSLTACASKKPVVVTSPRSVPGTVMPTEGVESVRYAENLKAYPVGRYVDPNNPLVMHERHTVYRVETTAKWNLHPNPLTVMPMGTVNHIVDPSHQESPVTAEILAEVSRQRAATQTLLLHGDRIQQSLSQFSALVTVNQQMSQQNSELKQQLSLTEKRLNALEQAVREKPSVPKPANNEADSW